MRPRFEPDVPDDRKPGLSPNLIDPEAFDASEEQFAASLERSATGRTARFIVEAAPSKSRAELEKSELPRPEEGCISSPEQGVEVSAEADLGLPALPEAPDPDAWRREVAARLSHYRARRPRAPHYPSLQLKFESEPVWHARVDAAEIPAVQGSPSPLPNVTERVDVLSAPRITLVEATDPPRILPAPINEATAKVIEFASYWPAPRPQDELAEPVLDRPRIIEAPELAPPPPALGGILIEPVEEPFSGRRPGFEIPLQAAPRTRRITAGTIDAVLVLLAFAAFGYIFLRMAQEIPPLSRVAAPAAMLAVALWSAYQYLLLVFTGTTPGLRLAKLELQRFDGSAVPRRLRAWRVLASVLSGVSLGLGYAWCLLDEDELCWHDRITRTYMAPGK